MIFSVECNRQELLQYRSQHSWLFDTFYRLNKFNLISGIGINDMTDNKYKVCTYKYTTHDI
jgi:hypothetical protein